MEPYTLLVIGGLTVSIHILRQFMPKIPTKFMPLVSIALGTLISVTDQAFNNGQPTLPNIQVLVDGLLTGLSAAGLWDFSKSLHKKE